MTTPSIVTVLRSLEWYNVFVFANHFDDEINDDFSDEIKNYLAIK